MIDYSILGSIMTLVSFLTFLGIVAWAYSRRRKQAFDAAAMEPFALPDEGAGSNQVLQAEQRGRP
jgi:cytochrome c oxidase cbb3-type subunit 4